MPSIEPQAALLDWGRDPTRRWLRILDRDLIGPDQPYLCGDKINDAPHSGDLILVS